MDKSTLIDRICAKLKEIDNTDILAYILVTVDGILAKVQ